MVFAGLAASAAVDLLSLLQPEKTKKSGTGAAKTQFSLPELGAGEAASTTSSVGSTRGQSALSTDTLGTLLSAQGQGQAHKKRSMSVLLDMLQQSQDGSVNKSDFATAMGDDDAKASEMFDRIDQNHDSSVNVAELSNYLDTYRRNSEAAATGKGRALAIAA